jgi:hypothetical protein
MPEREPVTVELDVEVAAMLREQTAARHVSEGEIVEARCARPICARSLAGSAVAATPTGTRPCDSSTRN